jgi:hypothetical protein
MEFNNIIANKINQFSNSNFSDEKGVYLSLLKVASILSSIKFTNRIEADYLYEDNDPKKYFTSDFDYYQRLINDKRTKDLVDFILTQIKNSIENNLFIIPFPTSFILSVYKTEIENFNDYKKIFKENSIDKIYRENLGVFMEGINITFPELEVILVVDGQHRLAALKAIYFALKRLNNEDIILKDNDPIYNLLIYTERKIKEYGFDLKQISTMFEDFQICCTILVDFDIWEQGKVFANVNFNQKSVNKSLYYDIFGSFPEPDKNDIYLAHRWCFNLNKREDSALKSKIKMLGTGDGYISQAFLCDSLVGFLKKGGIWYDVANNFSLDRKDDTNKIENFLVAFFRAVSEKYGIERAVSEKRDNYYWPNENDNKFSFNSVLFKTTGLGAIMKLIPHFYKLLEKYKNEEVNELTEKILNIFDENLNLTKLKERFPEDEENILTEKVTGEYYFKRIEGNFSSGAGLGLQMRLYNQLIKDFGFINENIKDTGQITLSLD